MLITLKEDVKVTMSSYTATGDIQHSPAQHALVFVEPVEPSEIITTNLSAYGLAPQEDTVFIKDWSEHQGLTASLVEAGVVEIVRELAVGPFLSRAYEVRVLLSAPANAAELDIETAKAA